MSIAGTLGQTPISIETLNRISTSRSKADDTMLHTKEPHPHTRHAQR